MLTIEKARELLGTLPKDVEEDPYFREAFLRVESRYLEAPYGEGWMKENRVAILSAWEYIRTLV